MNFSQFVKILYPFYGAGAEEADFIVVLTDNFMEKPNGTPNPIAAYDFEYRKRIYEGTRNISKIKATAILKHIDKILFEEYLRVLADKNLQGLCNSFEGHGFDASLDNITAICADIFEDILQNIASGKAPSKYIGVPLNNLPHKQNPYFIGREEKLEAIQNNFKSKEMVSLTQSVIGLGGVGKTSVALQYAYNHFKEYETIWWVNAETEQTTLAAFYDFGFIKKIINEDTKADEAVEAVKNWFNDSDNKKWIFIYDNADANSFDKWLEKYLPQTDNGHVLITTRSSTFPQSTTVNIDIFNSSEALLFLKKRTGKSGVEYTDESANELAKRLQNLPLALEQAAAYIEQTPDVTYEDYIALIEKYGIDVFKSKMYLVDYSSTIAITWKISMDKINKCSAVQMFNMCAYLAPDRIPVNVFVRGNEFLPGPLQKDITSDLERNEIIRDLTRYSLLSCENNKSIVSKENRVFYMHRLLQNVVQDNFGSSVEWLGYCLKLMYGVIDWRQADKNALDAFKMESPHAIAVAEKSKNIFSDEENLFKIGYIFNETGCTYDELGDYSQALELYTKALTIDENLYGIEHTETATSYANIGGVYISLGDYTQALEYCTKALAICEREHGEEHPETALIYSNIGTIYNELCEYEQALEYCKKALIIYEKEYGEEHPETAASYNNMGAIYKDLSNYDKALGYYEKALAVREKVYGNEHTETAASYNNLGEIYSTLGDNAKAAEYFSKALAIHENLFGKDHPYTARSYDQIGAICYLFGDHVQALMYHSEALKIRKKLYSEEHPDLSESYNNVGEIHAAIGNYEKALEFHNKSLEISKKIYRKEHPDKARSYNNIGAVYEILAEYEQALKHYHKALDIYERFYGEEHPLTAHSFNNIASVHTALADYIKALEYHNKALEVREKIYGEIHPDTATTYNNIGYVHAISGNNKQALKHYKKALSICKKIYGKEHPYVGSSLNNMGAVHYSLCDYEQALKFYGKALNIRNKAFGENHPETASSYNNIGSVYHQLGEYELALEHYNQALTVYENIYGKKHPDAATAHNNIGVVQKNLNHHKKALEHYNKALKIREKVYGDEHPLTLAVKNNIDILLSLEGK